MSKELESAIIKSPYKKMSYTEEHIREIARCADPVSGPQYFIWTITSLYNIRLKVLYNIIRLSIKAGL